MIFRRWGDITGKHGTTADDNMWVVKLVPETIPCVTAHTIVNRHSGTTLTYKASNKIKASNLIEPVNSPATTITYQASNSTLLTPGFEAKKGVVFKAKVGRYN